MQHYLVSFGKEEMVNAANEKLLPKFKNDPNLTDQE
jgi:hypothetical protein